MEYDRTIMKNMINKKIDSLDKEIKELEKEWNNLGWDIRDKKYEKIIFEKQRKLV